MAILTGQKCGVSKTIQCGMLTDRTGQGSNQGSLKQRENFQGFLVQVSIDKKCNFWDRNVLKRSLVQTLISQYDLWFLMQEIW